MAREPTLGELADDLAELKTSLAKIAEKIDGLPFVRSDLYQARHQALRDEVTAELARIRSDMEGVRGVANSSRAIAMWALGLICTAVVGVLFTFLTRAGGV